MSLKSLLNEVPQTETVISRTISSRIWTAQIFFYRTKENYVLKISRDTIVRCWQLLLYVYRLEEEILTDASVAQRSQERIP